MQQLVMCVARSDVQVAEGDGAAIESILRSLAQCTTYHQRVAQLHLLAKEMKQVCLPHRRPSHWSNSLSVCACATVRLFHVRGHIRLSDRLSIKCCAESCI